MSYKFFRNFAGKFSTRLSKHHALFVSWQTGGWVWNSSISFWFWILTKKISAGCHKRILVSRRPKWGKIVSGRSTNSEWFLHLKLKLLRLIAEEFLERGQNLYLPAREQILRTFCAFCTGSRLWRLMFHFLPLSEQLIFVLLAINLQQVCQNWVGRAQSQFLRKL